MKLTYRPEIDGLRAIAVGAVILYHAQITILGHQPFKGGFIGVDIFFVISGYLITSIILKELVTTGTFSFKHFYERRVRRILPALLFVMLVSLPFAWMYLLPSSFIDFSKSILYSLGFSSNFYFHYSGQIYGAESGLLKPFLHTWSLSVEEQFYILFPIVLLITFKYFRKYLIHILILGFAISLGLADWGSRNHPSFNFYVLPTRGWEVLAGSILAYFEVTSGRRSEIKTLNLILPSIGLLLIGHSILFFNDKMLHPSFYTLSPIIGVCLIIWFSNKDELITKLLSTKLFVGVGLISYSLYLWHYPIFAFAQMENIKIFENNIYIYILFSLVLSIFSFYFIERPFRNSKYRFKKQFIIISIITIAIIVFTTSIIKFSGFVERIDEKLLPENFDGRKKYKNIFNKCHARFDIKSEEFCKFGNFENTKNLYLVGDSHAVTLLFDLKEKLNNKEYNLISMTKPGQIFKIDTISEENTYQQKRLNKLNEIKNSIVVLFGWYNNNFTDERFKKNKYFEFDLEVKPYSKFFENLIKNNNQIFFIKPNPVILNPLWNYGNAPSINVLKRYQFGDFKEPKLKYLESLMEFNQFIKKLDNPNINLIDLENIFCDEIWCYSIKDGKILIADDDHPSLKGAEMINDLIMKEIEKIELKSN
jgi:peptidoglycan/LPS O-acetylase OafA/YrhL